MNSNHPSFYVVSIFLLGLHLLVEAGSPAVKPAGIKPYKAIRPVQGNKNAIPYNDTEILYVPFTNIHCGIQTIFSERIVGGTQAKKGEFPWLAAMAYKDLKNVTNPPKFLCGGVIVSERVILTASHCVHNLHNLELVVVRLGAWNLSSTTEQPPPIEYDVEQRIKHPKYDSSIFLNDIALLVLKTPKIPFSDHISPICLPYTKTLRQHHYTELAPTIAGWGKVNFTSEGSPILLKVKIPLTNLTYCKAAYKNFDSSKIDDTNLCAGDSGGKDACQGDSGGPLMFPLDGKIWVTISSVSYGYQCAEKEYPGVLARVSTHVDWIIENIKANPGKS